MSRKLKVINPVPPPDLPPIILLPWDRQDEESDTQWAAFQVFRDLPMGNRTMAETAREIGIRNTGNLYKWCVSYKWRDRAAAWDIHLDKIRQKGFEDEVRLMGERHARLGMTMQDLGGARIGQIASSPELQATMTVKDSIALVKVGTDIEREARATDKDKGTGDGGGITFNINMPGGLPKWAPKKLVVTTTKVLTGADVQVVEEGVMTHDPSQSQEADQEVQADSAP